MSRVEPAHPDKGPRNMSILLEIIVVALLAVLNARFVPQPYSWAQMPGATSHLSVKRTGRSFTVVLGKGVPELNSSSLLKKHGPFSQVMSDTSVWFHSSRSCPDAGRPRRTVRDLKPT